MLLHRVVSILPRWWNPAGLEWTFTGSTGILVLYNGLTLSVLRFGEMDFEAFLVGEIHQLESQVIDCQTTAGNADARTFRRCIGVGCQMRLEWAQTEVGMML